MSTQSDEARSVNPPPVNSSSAKKAKLHGYEWWRSIGSPRFVCGPMVDQSELAFRLLSRKYGTELAYTPMLHSRLFSTDPSYRLRHFSTTLGDRPLIAQLCGDCPETVLAAGRLLEDEARNDQGEIMLDAVDLNFGCPQGIARRGHYGSYLLHEPDLMCSIINALHHGLQHVPVCCKIRKVISTPINATVDLAVRLEAAGASMICVHGRTKEEKGDAVRECDWEVIKAVKQSVHIPVIANGGIETMSDALWCLEYTGCDAVMSAEALLEYPALFNSQSDVPIDVDLMAREYLDLVHLHHPHSVPDVSCVKAHLFHLLFPALQQFTELRDALSQAYDYDGFSAVAEAVRAKRASQGSVKGDQRGWYRRHRHPKQANGGKNVEDGLGEGVLGLLFGSE
eukprot:GHVN01045118.1.p1 GENE.GHVN01045118.1~~GHVN01045118.1.p1  ORF type:complete len:396 (+),score=61.30 GHVN01045118.1:340-1527(+)